MMTHIFLAAALASATESPVPADKLCDAFSQKITTQRSALPLFEEAYRSGRLSKLQKDEFETSSEWRARFRKMVKPLVGAGVLGHEELVFFSIPVSESALEYDAETELMKLRYRINTFGSRNARPHWQKNYIMDNYEKIVGSYRAYNAFGVSNYVKEVKGIRYTLRFSPFHFKDAPERFRVPRNIARKFKRSMKIGVLGGFARSGIKVEEARYAPNLDVPKDRRITTVSLHVQPVCIFLYGNDYVVSDWHLDLLNLRGIVKEEKRRFSDMVQDLQR